MSRKLTLKSKNYRVSPENDEKWTCDWIVTDKKTGEEKGRFRFCGAPEKGRVTIEKDGDEVALGEMEKQMIDWTFLQTDVYIIIIDGVRHDKPMVAYLAIAMCLGLCFGSSLGTATGHSAAFLGCGVALGVAIGVALDKNEKKHRSEVTGEPIENGKEK